MSRPEKLKLAKSKSEGGNYTKKQVKKYQANYGYARRGAKRKESN